MTKQAKHPHKKNTLTSSITKIDLSQAPEHPPVPLSFQNPKFFFCAQRLAIICKKYPHLSINVFGGDQYKTYINDEMHPYYLLNFGDMDLLVPSIKKEDIGGLLHFISNYSYYATQPMDINPKESLLSQSLVHFFNAIINDGGTIHSVYSKMNRNVVQIIYCDVKLDFNISEKNLYEHACMLDLSVGALYFDLRTGQMHAPFPQSLLDLLARELNFLYPHTLTTKEDRRQYAITKINEDPSILLRIIRASTTCAVGFHLATELTEIMSYYKHHATNMNINRLYYDFKLLFFSGHAVKNLNKIIEVELFDWIFSHLGPLSTDTKGLIRHFITCLARTTDQQPLFVTSFIYYAIHWDKIKTLPYDSLFSAQLFGSLINASTQADFNPWIDAVHREYLTKWEHEYQEPNHLIVESIIAPPYLVDTLCEQISKSTDEDSETITEALAKSQVTLPALSLKPSLVKIKKTKKTAQAWFEQGEHQFIEGCELDALTAFEKALEINPNHVPSLQKCVEISTKLNINNKALLHCSTLLQCEPNYQLYCQRGNLYLDLGQYNNARKDFISAEKLNTDLPDAYCNLGNLAKKHASDYQHLADHASLKMMSTINDGLIKKIKHEQANAKQNRDQKYLEARQYYEQALAKNPEFQQAVLALQALPQSKIEVEDAKLSLDTAGRNLKKKTRKKKSPEQAVSLIAESMTSDDTLFQEGLNNQQLGFYSRAVDCYKKSFTRDKNVMALQHCINVLLLILDKPQEAMKACDLLISITEAVYTNEYQALQSPPFDNFSYYRCNARYLRGTVFLMMAKCDWAIRDFAFVLDEYNTSKNDQLRELTASAYMNAGHAINKIAQIERKSVIMDDLQRKKAPTGHGNPHNEHEQEQAVIDQAALDRIVKKEADAKTDYQNALIMTNNLGADVSKIRIEATLGLGHIEQAQGNLTGAAQHYNDCLDIIRTNIATQFYSTAFARYHALYECAEFICDIDLDNAQLYLMGRGDMVMHESHQFVLAQKIYLEAIGHLPPQDYQPAHIRLIEIDFLLANFDAAIQQIKTLLLGDIKKTNYTRRALFFLLGRSHEMKKEYEPAGLAYKKASSSLSYKDDNRQQRQQCIDRAKTATERLERAKKRIAIAECVALAINENDLRCVEIAGMAKNDINIAKISNSLQFFNPKKSHSRENEYLEESAVFRQEIAKKPSDLGARRELIRIHFTFEKHNELIDECTYLLNITHEDFTTHYQKTQVLPWSNYEYYCLYAFYYRGNAYMKHKEYELAISDFTKLTEYYSKNPYYGLLGRIVDSYLNIGTAHLRIAHAFPDLYVIHPIQKEQGKIDINTFLISDPKIQPNLDAAKIAFTDALKLDHDSQLAHESLLLINKVQEENNTKIVYLQQAHREAQARISQQNIFSTTMDIPQNNSILQSKTFGTTSAT